MIFVFFCFFLVRRYLCSDVHCGVGRFLRLTLGRFRACADAILGTVDLLPLHHDVLKAFVVGVEAVLQQFAERHHAAPREEHGKCRRMQKFQMRGGKNRQIMSRI